MKKKLESFLIWLEEKRKPLFYLAVFFYLIAILFVFFLWALGYICNANFAMSYELESCWAGVSAVFAGLVPLTTMGVSLWKQESEATKQYSIDSQYNSIAGQMPSFKRQ